MQRTGSMSVNVPMTLHQHLLVWNTPNSIRAMRLLVNLPPLPETPLLVNKGLLQLALPTIATSAWKICLMNLFLEECTSWMMSPCSVSLFFSKKPREIMGQHIDDTVQRGQYVPCKQLEVWWTTGCSLGCNRRNEWAEKGEPREGRQRHILRQDQRCKWCKALQFCHGHAQTKQHQTLLTGTTEGPSHCSQKRRTATLLWAPILLCSNAAASHLPPNIPSHLQCSMSCPIPFVS